MLEQNVVNIEEVTSRNKVSPFEMRFFELKQRFQSDITQNHSWRVEQLSALERMTLENKHAVLSALKKDLGKSETEAWLAEIGYLISTIKLAKRNLKKWMKPINKKTPLLAQPGTSYLKPEPLGVVLIIGAWNYPYQLTLAPLVAAISAGNCAVLKPSEFAPSVSKVISELLPMYLDSSAYKVIEGGKEETSQLLELPFDKIFYTGGEAVGKVVMAAAAKHLTPVTLELGGKSPCIVDGKTNLEVAARRIIWSKIMNMGQTCVAPDYVLIERRFQSLFIELLIKSLKEQYSSCDIENEDFGRIINSKHTQRLANYLEGQDIVFGGSVDVEKRFVQPTLVKNPPIDSPVMNEEIFGPILPIVAMTTKQQMLDFVGTKAKPLAAYLFTDDKEFEREFVNRVSSGSMCINDTSIFIASHELPFGGVGKSGMGRYHGKYGFDTFSHFKSVMKRSYRFDASARYAPFSKLKLSILKWFS